MLRVIGAKSIEDLLAPIPADVRLKRPLKLPAAQPPALDPRLQLLAPQPADRGVVVERQRAAADRLDGGDLQRETVADRHRVFFRKPL